MPWIQLLDFQLEFQQWWANPNVIVIKTTINGVNKDSTDQNHDFKGWSLIYNRPLITSKF